MISEQGDGVLTLSELLSTGEWMELPGTPGSTMYLLTWSDDTTDTLIVPLDPDESVHVYRTNRSGLPVWIRQGTERFCLDEYAALEDPVTLDARVNPSGTAGYPIDWSMSS